MRTRQKRPKTAVDQCLSILLRNTRDFELQLFELNKLRYQVWQAELSARNRARSALRSPSAKPTPAAFLESCRGLSADQRRSHPTIRIEVPEHRGGYMMTAIEAGLISVPSDGRGAGLARAPAPIGRHSRGRFSNHAP